MMTTLSFQDGLKKCIIFCTFLFVSNSISPLAAFPLRTTTTTCTKNCRDSSNSGKQTTQCQPTSQTLSRNNHHRKFQISASDDNQIKEDYEYTSLEQHDELEQLSSLLGIQPADTIESKWNGEAVRGVYLKRNLAKGDIILMVPLDSCLCDDKPPAWMEQEPNEDDDDDSMDSSIYNPSGGWATRLAASLLDLQMQSLKDDAAPVDKGKQAWLASLPNPDYLRASLPVHWPETILQSARCTALELMVDSAYFARADSVGTLLSALLENYDFDQTDDKKRSTMPELQQQCHNALDIVQTRSCRVEVVDSQNLEQQPRVLRILAPVFDFINHGYTKSSASNASDKSANAAFALEPSTTDGTSALVVRATRDVKAQEEVLIDYGPSASPPWSCLASYGFVPSFAVPTTASNNVVEDDSSNPLAELYMNGIRHEVGPTFIPIDLVAAAASSIKADYCFENNDGDDETEDETEESQEELVEGCNVEENQIDDAELTLTPEIALRIANRLSAVAFQLLLDPEEEGKGSSIDNDEDDASMTDGQDENPYTVTSSILAAALRFSQHRILLACAMGIREYISS